MKPLPIHPAAEAVPEMTAEEFQRLKERIAKVGQLEDIVVHHGEVIDGRHRQRACLELGIEPRYRHDDELANHDGSVCGFVLDASTRRNLTPSQLSMLANDLLPEIEKHTKRGRPKKRGDDVVSGKSAEQAARAVGVSARSVARAKNVARDGSEKLQQAVRNGRLNLTEAEKAAKKLTRKAQDELLEDAPFGELSVKMKAALAKKPKPPTEGEAAEKLIAEVERLIEYCPKEHRIHAVASLLAFLEEKATADDTDSSDTPH